MLERPTIAITGSKGKTTIKEMIYSILSQQWTVFKSKKNGNDPWFIKQYKQEISPIHKALVLEYGMLQPKDIQTSCQLIQPNIGIICNVGNAHRDNFNSLQAIANVKSELIQGMQSEGILFLNADDKNSSLLKTKHFIGKIITIGIKNNADYKGYEITHDYEGIYFKIKLKNRECRFRIPSIGRHNAYNALFAVAIADHLGFSEHNIERGLAHYEIPALRLNQWPGKNFKIIDDSFNSSPESMMAAIDVLAELGQGTKIAILGGEKAYPMKLYFRIGRHLAQNKIDYLYTLGDVAKTIIISAIRSGFLENNCIHSANNQMLYKHLFKRNDPFATYLIKGENAQCMYHVTNFLKVTLQVKALCIKN